MRYGKISEFDEFVFKNTKRGKRKSENFLNELPPKKTFLRVAAEAN